MRLVGGFMGVICLCAIIVAQSGGFGGPMTAPAQQQIIRNGSLQEAASPGQAVLPAGVSEITPGEFVISDTRPLEVASELLSRKLGVSIAYEEAAWLSSSDVMFASDHPENAVAAAANRTRTPAIARGPLIPRGGTLRLSIPIGKAVNSQSVIQSAVDEHRNQRNPGEFKVIQIASGEYSIVADFANNERGAVVKQSNPLDLRISIPEAERSYGDMLDTIFTAVSVANRSRGGLLDVSPLVGSNPRSIPIRFGASNEVARDVLARALRRPRGQKTTWSVRFDPQNKVYGIYLRSVQQEVVIPGQGVGLKPLLPSQ